MSVKRYTAKPSDLIEVENGYLVLHSDYAALLARHNELKDAAKGLIAVHRRHKDLIVYSKQDYIDIWCERVDALDALVGGSNDG